MRPRSTRLARPATVAVAALIMALALSAGASARSLKTGFADILFQNPKASVRAHWLNKARAAHSKVVRLNVPWSSVAPTEPADPRDPNDPAYQFGTLDAAVRSARSKGMTVMLTVYQAPTWAEGRNRPGSADAGSWRPKSGPYGALGHALAKRYSGHFAPSGGRTLPRVKYYEAWNEPNLSHYLAPQYRGRHLTGASIYRKLLDAFYRGVHSSARGDKVISGGLAPYGEAPGHDRTRPLTFLRSLFCLRGRTALQPRRCPVKARLDVAGDHPIDTAGGPRTSAINPNDVATPDFKNFAKTVRAAERHHTIRPGGKRPLWATEIWWETDPPDRAFGVSPRKQARYLGGALRILKRQGASVVINLQIRDAHTPRNGDGVTATGLYFQNNRAKPSLRAWRSRGR